MGSREKSRVEIMRLFILVLREKDGVKIMRLFMLVLRGKS